VTARRRRTAPSPVDWAELRRRVDAVGRVLAGAADPERARAVLEQRARALARPATAPTAAGSVEAVTFALANERCAIESRYVFEVFRLKTLSPLPGATPPVSGVTAWRGDLLPVLDLRLPLGLPVAALNDLSRVIVLGRQRPAFGVLADAVLELVTIAVADVQAPPAAPEAADTAGTAGAAARDYLRGITPQAVVVLDGERLLRLGELDPA
jgi:purine-binding chemotaxis protein CheW